MEILRPHDEGFTGGGIHFLFSLEKGVFFSGLGGLDKTGWNVKFGPYYIIIIIFINKLVS